MDLKQITRQKLAELHAVDTSVVTKRLLRLGIFHSTKLNEIEVRKYFDANGWPDSMRQLKISA